MPVYTYRCENCGVQFDQYLKYTDAPPTRCPECGKKALKKVFQPVGIVFKGSGFYATDHHSPSGQKAQPSNGETKTAEGGETKPAAPKESKPEKGESKKD